MRLQVGAVVFDSDRRQLLRGTAEVHLSPKAFRLLEALIDSRPRALSKAELHERVWPGVFVSETNLAALVSEVRSALGDNARRPVFVRTVHGFGYAFAVDAPGQPQAGGAASAEPPIAQAAPAAMVHHRLIWGATEIGLSEGKNVIGREREADIWIADPSVSRRHAVLEVKGMEVTLEDLRSKNGTFLEEERVAGPVALADGAALRVGSIALRYRTVSTTASTLTKSDG